MLKNVTAAIKWITKGMKAYIISGRWHDRHGEDGRSQPRMCMRLVKARKVLADTVIAYLKEKGAVNDDGTIDYRCVYSINGNEVNIDGKPPYNTVDEVRKAIMAKGVSEFSVDVDNDGTWADWGISLTECED